MSDGRVQADSESWGEFQVKSWGDGAGEKWVGEMREARGERVGQGKREEKRKAD